MKTHDNTLLRVKLGFLALFLLVSAGLLFYGTLYEMPRRKCEAAGGWWTDKYRSCETPVYLPMITGRKAGEPRRVIWPSKEAERVSNPTAQSATSASATKP